MNSDNLSGKWKQLRGSIKEKWGKLTDDDLTYIDGKHDQFVGKLQERYGISREEAQRNLDEWLSHSDNAVRQTAGAATHRS